MPADKSWTSQILETTRETTNKDETLLLTYKERTEELEKYYNDPSRKTFVRQFSKSQRAILRGKWIKYRIESGSEIYFMDYIYPSSMCCLDKEGNQIST